MFNLLTVNVMPSNYGPEFSGFVLSGPGASADKHLDGSVAAPELPLPWRTNLQPGAGVFEYLQWRTALSPFGGRDKEIATLLDWADSDSKISAKFLIGEGGTGKTRLAAELATELRAKGWAAGFPDFRTGNAYLAKKKGTLLIIDYPEEQLEGVRAIFSELSRLEEETQAHPLRILFLSRQLPDAWRGLANETRAATSVDWTPISLGALPTEDAYNAFHAVLEAVAEAEDTIPRPVPMEEFYAWLESAPENRQTLFIVAAGVHCALHDDVTPWVEYRGSEVMVGLAEREASRLRGMAQGQGWQDESLCRLVSLAAVAGKLEGTQIERLAAESSLDLGFPTEPGLLDTLKTLGLLAEDISLPAPAPDILAASFLVQAFRNRPDKAGEWLWAGIEDDSNDGLSRIARLAYDSEIVLGIHDARPSRWLAEAVTAHPERCKAILGQLTLGARLRGLLPAAVAAGKKLLEDETLADEKRAGILNNLSLDLAEGGKEKEALEHIQEAVKIRRRLAKKNPSRFEPDLALSLNNLPDHLARSGDDKGALEVSLEAVEIRRRLADQDPASFEPVLALSLNNHSNRLAEMGENKSALEAVQESIEIRRQLAQENPARFEPDLALSLNNQSNHLAEMNENKSALEAVQESIEIRRRLAEENPARFEPDLAATLNNLSNRLAKTGKKKSALEAVKESVEIRRRLANENPARFESDLAISLNNQSNRLAETGENISALEIIQESIEINRRLADKKPPRFKLELATSLGALGTILRSAGRPDEADAAFREAITVVELQANQFPESPAADLLKRLRMEIESTSEDG